MVESAACQSCAPICGANSNVIHKPFTSLDERAAITNNGSKRLFAPAHVAINITKGNQKRSTSFGQRESLRSVQVSRAADICIIRVRGDPEAAADACRRLLIRLAVTRACAAHITCHVTFDRCRCATEILRLSAENHHLRAVSAQLLLAAIRPTSSPPL